MNSCEGRCGVYLRSLKTDAQCMQLLLFARGDCLWPMVSALRLATCSTSHFSPCMPCDNDIGFFISSWLWMDWTLKYMLLEEFHLVATLLFEMLSVLPGWPWSYHILSQLPRWDYKYVPPYPVYSLFHLQGRRFLSFLFSWNIDFIKMIHETIKNQLSGLQK